MDKPKTLSMKDYLIRVLSVRNNIPVKVIEAVIDNQQEEAHKALNSKTSVELSGFGKFVFNYKKALKKKEKIEKTIQKHKDNPKKVKDLEAVLTIINARIHEYQSNSGGVEKQAGPCSRYEECDRAYFEGKTEDM